jgi:hypothetical protein
MAQEDKGLVLRGLALLAVVGCIVAFVLTALFRRNEPPAAAKQTPPEHYVPLAIAPSLAPFPSSVSWAAVVQLGETLPSAPGFDVRYNAALTLARRGSFVTPWPLLGEMLNEKLQLRNSRVTQPDGQDIYDEFAARHKMIRALEAIATWHKMRKADTNPVAPTDLRDIYPIVDQLAENSDGEVKKQAEETRKSFFR